MKTQIAIIGSGNIGTDLLLKVIETSKHLEPVVLVGIDPDSDGLARARKLGVATTHDGVDGLLAMEAFGSVDIIFDATSAATHHANAAALAPFGKQIVDLTPAAIGPFTVPVVNLQEQLAENNINMVTCGGQATIPIVAAVSRVATVRYAEIVASVSSRSAGPGTRANIDEFTQTTALGLEKIGKAKRGKAIIILNPAEPPMLMRNTVFTLCDEASDEDLRRSIEDMVADVQEYVPGYRLKQKVQFEHYSASQPLHIPGYGDFWGLKCSVFLEVEGAGHYLPKYAGNLDVMTSAALATGERLADLKFAKQEFEMQAAAQTEPA